MEEFKERNKIEALRENTPEVLKANNHWILWKRVGEKKPPFSIEGKPASVNDPNTWSSFEDAVTTLEKRKGEYSGVGYVLTSGLVVIDLDHCIKLVNGIWHISKFAKKILGLTNSLTETSPSNEGLHIFLLGSIEGNGNRNSKSTIEMYENSRYITITGKRYPHTASEIRADQKAIQLVHSLYISRPEEAIKPVNPYSSEKLISDSQVLEKALKARNSQKFKRLWTGNISEFRTEGGEVDESRADLALCSMLVYWTNGNYSQIDRLFRQSGLMRPKWDEIHDKEGHTYGELTIKQALEGSKRY